MSSNFFMRGGRIAWALLIGVILTLATSAALLGSTANERYTRDVTRMVYNDNLELLERVRQHVGLAGDSLQRLLDESADSPNLKPYLVISTAENRLWFRQGDSVLFETRTATGSGKTLVRSDVGSHWRFETPRGRLVVQGKDVDPAWIPPDWHYIEQAQKRKLGLAKLNRGEAIPTSDGGVVTVRGSDVVKRTSSGSVVVLDAADGREIVIDGKIVVPPFGTKQRRYEGVLGTHRLNLGDGYAIHGTNNPASIGQSVSHGCVRVLNQDIQLLYNMVPVGTPVFIY